MSLSEQGSYQVGQAHITLEQELRRLDAQVVRTWPKEARELHWLGLQDGMSVLEVGCGPGFWTEHLEQLVPTSPIVAIDADPGAILYASLRREWRPTTSFVTASVLDSGLPEGHFDFAVARYVFQHLRNPNAAASEILRMLRPGGKLLIIDTDVDIAGLISPALPVLEELQPKTTEIQARHGGDRRIGRRIWRILANAGFTDLVQDAMLTSSDSHGLEPFLLQLNPDRLVPLVRQGLLSETDYVLIQQAYDRLRTADDPLVLDLVLMACGTKLNEKAPQFGR